MWDYVGIVRSQLRLERAFRRMEFLQNEIETFFKKTRVTEGSLELRNLAECGMLIIRSAMKRRETRGLQVRTDFRERNDTDFLSDTTID